MNHDNVKIKDEKEFSNILSVFCSGAAVKTIFMAECGTTKKEIKRETEYNESAVYRLLDRLRDLNLIKYDSEK